MGASLAAAFLWASLSSVLPFLSGGLSLAVAYLSFDSFSGGPIPGCGLVLGIVAFFASFFFSGRPFLAAVYL